jgi:hypothetical protein
MILAGLAAAVALPQAALAQTTTSTAGPFRVSGNVPAMCSVGTLSTGNTNFELGVLSDTTTGLLRAGMSAAPKVMAGSFCTSRSNISVSATPLVSMTNTGAPGAGFSRTVNYTATASGWTANPAVFVTGATNNGGATQERTTAFTGDITVSIGSFTTGGGDSLRLVADPSYQGSVTVTVSVAN